MDILYGYTKSMFPNFKSFLRTEIDLAEDDIRLVLDENNSKFITYEISRDNYTFKDLFEVPLGMMKFASEGFNQWIVIELDNL